jgi:hypothetical protein
MGVASARHPGRGLVIRDVASQRGSHIRLQKHTPSETIKVTVPTHRPIKRSTLSHMLKQARLSVDDFIALL